MAQMAEKTNVDDIESPFEPFEHVGPIKKNEKNVEDIEGVEPFQQEAPANMRFGSIDSTLSKKTNKKDTGCMYDAQGSVVCGLPIGKMANTINRRKDTNSYRHDIRRDTREEDEDEDEDPEFLTQIGWRDPHGVFRSDRDAFTYNPNICCRKHCGRVAPCGNADATISNPDSMCSACQRGFCHKMC